MKNNSQNTETTNIYQNIKRLEKVEKLSISTDVFNRVKMSVRAVFSRTSLISLNRAAAAVWTERFQTHQPKKDETLTKTHPRVCSVMNSYLRDHWTEMKEELLFVVLKCEEAGFEPHKGKALQIAINHWITLSF